MQNQIEQAINPITFPSYRLVDLRAHRQITIMPTLFERRLNMNMNATSRKLEDVGLLK